MIYLLGLPQTTLQVKINNIFCIGQAFRLNIYVDLVSRWNNRWILEGETETAKSAVLFEITGALGLEFTKH